MLDTFEIIIYYIDGTGNLYKNIDLESSKNAFVCINKIPNENKVQLI